MFICISLTLILFPGFAKDPLATFQPTGNPFIPITLDMPGNAPRNSSDATVKIFYNSETQKSELFLFTSCDMINTSGNYPMNTTFC